MNFNKYKVGDVLMRDGNYGFRIEIKKVKIKEGEIFYDVLEDDKLIYTGVSEKRFSKYSVKRSVKKGHKLTNIFK